jgi:hypothetical protein
MVNFWLECIGSWILLVKRAGMARLRKKPEDRKDYHLRVPLTPGQRALIEDVAKLHGEEKASWARAVLVSAARRTLAKDKEVPPRC